MKHEYELKAQTKTERAGRNQSSAGRAGRAGRAGWQGRELRGKYYPEGVDPISGAPNPTPYPPRLKPK